MKKGKARMRSRQNINRSTAAIARKRARQRDRQYDRQQYDKPTSEEQ